MHSILSTGLEQEDPFPVDWAASCVHELFEAQVKRTPDVTAIVFQDEQIEYDELNRRANRLAAYLQKVGVAQNRPVGLCLERSPWMVIGLLAILKAGGCYVPLDPSYPQERLALIAQDADLQVLITTEALWGSLPAVANVMQESSIVYLDRTWPRIRQESAQNLRLAVQPEHLLYLLFTSGSTGTPKGVAMPHRALANLIGWQQRQIPTARGQRTLQFTPLSFDVASQEIFATLCFGGTLVLVSEATRQNPQALWTFLNEHRIARLFLPFVALQQLADVAGGKRPAALETVVTAGEQLQITSAISQFFQQSGCSLHNHYGPTESHVVTAYPLPTDVGKWPELPPIGSPIANVQIYLLDKQMQAVPNGESGELYIGGICLAHGYYGRPDLTEERFVRNPFGAERLYKTGDLARYLPDGHIEYLGRIDHQVKIRGFRVEVGEVEVMLMHHRQVRTAVVTAREDAPGVKRLVAYIVLEEQGQPDISTQLRDYLEEKLPDYMIPARFAFLEQLPLTPSGKIDRKRLPAPQTDRPSVKTPLRHPKTEIERQLAILWQEALVVDEVGIDDNFFELGGTSLLLTQLHAQLVERFPQVEMVDLLQYPTIHTLAQQVQQRTNGKSTEETGRVSGTRVRRKNAVADRRRARRSHRAK